MATSTRGWRLTRVQRALKGAARGSSTKIANVDIDLQNSAKLCVDSHASFFAVTSTTCGCLGLTKKVGTTEARHLQFQRSQTLNAQPSQCSLCQRYAKTRDRHTSKASSCKSSIVEPHAIPTSTSPPSTPFIPLHLSILRLLLVLPILQRLRRIYLRLERRRG